VDAGIKFCFYNVNSFLEKTAFERVASWGIIKNCDAVNKDNAKLRNAIRRCCGVFIRISADSWEGYAPKKWCSFDDVPDENGGF